MLKIFIFISKNIWFTKLRLVFSVWKFFTFRKNFLRYILWKIFLTIPKFVKILSSNFSCWFTMVYVSWHDLISVTGVRGTSSNFRSTSCTHVNVQVCVRVCVCYTHVTWVWRDSASPSTEFFLIPSDPVA